MNRRQFAQYTAAALTNVAGIQIGRTQTGPNAPTKMSSVNGVLDAVIEAGFAQRTFGGRQYKLVAYNNTIPGPTLEARAGDLVRLRLVNRLDHPTNLHFHGLHISPGGTADNSFVRVDSGDSFLYEFRIPANHAPGLYWYHPHMHALSNIQTRSGMAGLISIRGDFDMTGDLPGAVEHDIVIQNLEYFVYDPPHTAHLGGVHVHHPAPVPPLPPVLTINGMPPERDAAGLVRETVKVKTHGLLRMRILQAASNRTAQLALVNPARVLGHHPFQIATDGVPLAIPELVHDLVMPPGSRSEILVETNLGGGKFSLYDMPFYNGFAVPGAAAAMVTFEYDGVAPRGLRLPERFGVVEALPQPSSPPRRFELSIQSEGGVNKFLINGLEFDPNRVDTRVKLGSIEDWDIENSSFEDHSFHIHTNPFQVLDRYGNPEPSWRDTILVNRGRTVRIRMRFSDFAGKSLYHCHSLVHEDNSMMQILDIEE